MRPCITPVILILRFVTMNENMFLVNPASKLRIIKKKKTIMFSFLLLVSCESQQMRVLPPTSQLTSTLPHRHSQKTTRGGDKRANDILFGWQARCYGVKESYLSFCKNTHSSNLRSVRIDTMPHHDSRQTAHTNLASHPPLQPTHQSRNGCLPPCVTAWHQHYHLPLAPGGPYAAGVRGVAVHLLYSCGFVSASRRTGRELRERNT